VRIPYLPGQAAIDIRSLLASLDAKAIYAAFMKEGIQNAKERAKKLFGEATGLYARIDRFEEIEQTLKSRYETHQG
jgi:hypothetical protein